MWNWVVQVKRLDTAIKFIQILIIPTRISFANKWAPKQEMGEQYWVDQQSLKWYIVVSSTSNSVLFVIVWFLFLSFCLFV